MQDHDHKQALPGGYRLKGYRVVEVLGVGGFGVTYLADDLTLRRRVAIKEYLPNEFAVRDGVTVQPKSSKDRPDFEWGLARFLDEARTLAQFRHPNLVRVVEYFEANSTAYIVMEYEEGESLAKVLRRHGRLSEAQLSRVLWPIVDGLRQVHAAGYLHRDIKPSNVYVRYSDQSPVLLDFGAARQALGRKSKSLTALASAGYSPPEQYESEGEQGPWTDIYALSALCYRAISGDPPLEAPRRLIRLVRGQPDPQPKLSETIREGYSPLLLSAVDCGLQTVETQRPGSLEEWVEILEGKEGPRVSASAVPTLMVGVEQQRKAPALTQSTPREESVARVSGKRTARWAAVAVLMVLGAWWFIPINVNDQGEEVRVPTEQPPVIEMPRPTNEDVAADALPPGRESVLGGGAVLVVETTPEGVEVLLDGEPVGVTPLELGNVRAGTRDVVLHHPDYETLELADESFVDERVLRIERTLVRATGAFTVVTQPREAWVESDGVRLANGTPVTLDDLPAGTVELTLGAESYRSVTVTAKVPGDGVGRLEWTLEPIPYGTLTLEVEPLDAVVRLPDIGPAYEPGMALPKGEYRVTVSRDGYEAVVRTVVVSGETREQIVLELSPQPFTVQVSPAGARVELVDLAEAYTPGMPLNPGDYRIRVSADEYEMVEETVRHGRNPTEHVLELTRSPQPFTVDTSPLHATVELLDYAQSYAPGIRLEPGEYRVRVSAPGYRSSEEVMRHGSDATRNHVTLVRYTSSETVDFADNTTTLGMVAINGTASGTIGFSGDRDWFRVEFLNGQRYRIDLEGRRTSAGILNDPFLYGVYDASGNMISGTANDDGGGLFSLNSRLIFWPAWSGTYFISAGGFRENRGPYRLEVIAN